MSNLNITIINNTADILLLDNATDKPWSGKSIGYFHNFKYKIIEDEIEAGKVARVDARVPEFKDKKVVIRYPINIFYTIEIEK